MRRGGAVVVRFTLTARCESFPLRQSVNMGKDSWLPSRRIFSFTSSMWAGRSTRGISVGFI